MSGCEPLWSFSMTKNIEHFMGASGSLITVMIICKTTPKNQTTCPIIILIMRAIVYVTVVGLWSADSRSWWTGFYYMADLLLLCYMISIPNPNLTRDNLWVILTIITVVAAFGLGLFFPPWMRVFMVFGWGVTFFNFLFRQVCCWNRDKSITDDLRCTKYVLLTCVFIQIIIHGAKIALNLTHDDPCNQMVNTLEFFFWKSGFLRVSVARNQLSLSLLNVIFAFFDIAVTEIMPILLGLGIVLSTSTETSQWAIGGDKKQPGNVGPQFRNDGAEQPGDSVRSNMEIDNSQTRTHILHT